MMIEAFIDACYRDRADRPAGRILSPWKRPFHSRAGSRHAAGHPGRWSSGLMATVLISFLNRYDL